MSFNMKISFTGTTNIYALSDTHQDTRKTSSLLSQILNDKQENSLVLNCGDIFKGVYSRDLERDVYLKLKEAKPDAEMIMTLGNNDFGFNQENLDYLVNTIKLFSEKGIQTVCSNVFELSGKRPQWLKPYSIVDIDGDRTFVTGMCIDNINTRKMGLIPKKSTEVVDEIVEAIKIEKPDNIILLNHDYKPSSQNLAKEFKNKGVNIDLIIGGHDHDCVPADTQLNIYHPQPFAKSMYKMKLINSKNNKELQDVQEIMGNHYVSDLFEESLAEYEDAVKLNATIAKSTLDLPKRYSAPGALGSFLADEMVKIADADIGFVSTGFIMQPLHYKKNGNITNYDLMKTICAETPIHTVKLTAYELKNVFNNAFAKYGYNESNPKFLQCSNNVKITGKNNIEQNIFEVEQIYINDNPLFDKNGKSDLIIKCAIDDYIANGGQGNTFLQNTPKTLVNIPINSILINGLKKAEYTYDVGTKYPAFEIIKI